MKKNNEKTQPDPLDEFDFFDIDPNNLVRECCFQPKLFFKYASELADAEKRESESRAAREVVRAEVGLKIRLSPGKFGLGKLDKITEAVITGKILKHPKYIKAQKKRLVRKKKTDMLKAAVNALNHRKSQLENMTRLHGQNYFAVPYVDEGMKQSIDELTKATVRTKKKKKKLDQDIPF